MTPSRQADQVLWPNVPRVGPDLREPRKLKDVRPIYPPAALESQVSGVVILHLLIDEQGRVGDARILRSVPLLDQAALDAVRQWQYEPTLLNGKPTAVQCTVTLSFSTTRR